jgi:hypothetical protein
LENCRQILPPAYEGKIYKGVLSVVKGFFLRLQTGSNKSSTTFAELFNDLLNDIKVPTFDSSRYAMDV